MVDLGISFPDDSMPGIDVVLPDLSFIEARREQLAGLVLTHGHEDHLGAIPYMWSKLGCPVYGSAFTLALLRRKLAENNNPHDIPLIELSPGMVEDIGAFSVEMVGMAHSIPDPTSLAIRCGAERFFTLATGSLTSPPGSAPIPTATALPRSVTKVCLPWSVIRLTPWSRAAPHPRQRPKPDFAR